MPAPNPRCPSTRFVGEKMETKYEILCLGASYGSLLATKLALGGHDTTLVCLPAEADLINSEGAIVRMPIRGRDGLIEIRSTELPGSVSAIGPQDADPAQFDLCVMAMQEPQYRQEEVRVLVKRIAEAGLPCMSIMNMPPLPYLTRIPELNVEACRESYTDASVWDGFDPALMTLCSPDPQAFRPPEEPVNVLQVRLPTNFKAARFESDQHTAILRQLESDVQAARWTMDGEECELPVKLRVHDSIYVPMAKWCMLLAGNYRCILSAGVQPIREAVHGDLEESRRIYDWVAGLCVSLGASAGAMVPFEKYADAAKLLTTPSSAARALAAGAPDIERVDKLVQSIAAQRGQSIDAVDRIVETVDNWLQRNR